MKNLKLLDCTLRDGGFVNNWEFGHGCIVNFFERSVSAGIDYVETGFLDEREAFDINRTMVPDTDGMNEVFKGLEKGNSKVFGMIDFGTCSLDRICDAKDSFLDGIRVMVKKKTRFEALEFCGELKKKGYIVFAQPVSITGYTDEELIDLIEHINKVRPDGTYIVDTYGLLDRTKILHYFHLIDAHLDKDIALGYHAHNNFQLAYSNSMALCEEETDRTLIIDGSAYGIGKSAGNCPLELLTMYANEHYGKNYDTNQILEMIDSGIMKIYEKSPWGYQMQYYLCASNDCHPKYAQYLLQKKTLSVASINDILKGIEKKESLAFNQAHIEKLYMDYQNKEINDTSDVKALNEALSGKKVLLLGPGPSMGKEEQKIQAFVAKNAPVVIAINYIPEEFHVNYIFLSNSKRYMQLSTALSNMESSDCKVIATSNVTPAKGSFDYSVDYSGLVDMNFEIPDNSLPMLLRLLEKAGVKNISLAGFDGYEAKSGVNYRDAGMEYEFVADYAVKLNDYTAGVIKELGKKIDIEFVTRSKYETV
ncbi:MAG: aldolase catalytic domain-containing protein [Lachnospiraceae bacterium]|nr:aldolase catalytic domain-containing protein [Lachnospiraceae bacterium]